MQALIRSSACSAATAILVCIASLAFAADSPSPAKLSDADIPAVSDALLRDAIELAGANRGKLEAALDYCIQKPFTMEAMRFLIANLPLADLGSISTEMLIETVELAMEAYFSHDYADYDAATWAHYVLPPRNSQEPLSDWRPYFKAELEGLVADCAILEEAAIIVNKWCGERVGFKQTQRRDQGPLTTLKSGYGRCEEMVIVYVCACRSVGIPVRQASCPWWSWGDNNHAWVEVLGSDGRWHYVGGCEPRDSLDDAWYNTAVKRAPIVGSRCFGLPEEMGPEVLRYNDKPGARYCQINSISFYRSTGVLRVELLNAVSAMSDPDRSYKADDSIDYWLYVYVFNFGALRPIVKMQVDDTCSVEIELGAGKYVLSTDLPVAKPMVWAEVTDGEETTIDWLSAPLVPDDFILEFPADEE